MDVLRVNAFGRTPVHRLAEEQGLYRAEGLEVELSVTHASKAQMGELLAGVWDFVHTNADNVFYWSEDRGADFVIVLALPGRPDQNLVVQREIQSYADLRGKPLAVDAAESGFATPLRVLLRQAGREVGRDITFVEVGATQERIAALGAGHAYGAMLNADWPAEAQGFRVLDSINRLFTHYANTAAVRRSWAAQHAELLVRYLRAYLRATLLQAGQGTSGARPPPFAWEGIREMLEMRRQVGLLRGPVDPHRFADESFYRMAVQGW